MIIIVIIVTQIIVRKKQLFPYTLSVLKDDILNDLPYRVNLNLFTDELVNKDTMDEKIITIYTFTLTPTLS